jgi:hypothetical protein
MEPSIRIVPYGRYPYECTHITTFGNTLTVFATTTTTALDIYIYTVHILALGSSFQGSKYVSCYLATDLTPPHLATPRHISSATTLDQPGSFLV